MRPSPQLWATLLLLRGVVVVRGQALGVTQVAGSGDRRSSRALVRAVLAE